MTKPVPREGEPVGRKWTEAARTGDFLHLPHLFRCQPARQRVEIVDPQEIARSRMMTCKVDERQQQRMHIVDGDRR